MLNARSMLRIDFEKVMNILILSAFEFYTFLPNKIMEHYSATFVTLFAIG